MTFSPAQTSPKLAEQLGSQIAGSTHVELDSALQLLQANKQSFARLPIAERIRIIDRIHDDLAKVEQRWVGAGMRAKGTQLRSIGESEEWFTLTVTYRQLRYLRQSLVEIERDGKPKINARMCWKNAGRWEVDLFPRNWKDRVALPFIHAQAWLYDSYRGDEPPMAAFYREKEPQGKVILILAAGNIASQVTYDILHKVFVEGGVVLLKMNPVNDYLAELVGEAFAALIEPGYLRIARGGAEVGEYLTQHLKVDEIHLTGSARTYEAVAFGSGAEGQKRKQEKRPLVTKRFTAELGNVSPVIIVPGPWSQRDVRAQAAKIGSWLAPNAGFNCLTPRVLIQSKNWEKRAELNQAIVDYLAKIETRKAYYPGANKLHQAFTAEHPESNQIGSPKEGELPWTVAFDVNSANAEDICFRREAFFGFCAETALEAKDTVDFIDKAVKFANLQLWGSLCASIIVHPKSMEDPLIKGAVDQAIEDLNYGTVVVNHWGALPYYLALAPWGAPPGHDMYDIQSGMGKVNNPLMFDEPIKSVVRAPFISFPDPYMVHLKNSYRYFRQDMRYQSNPTTWNLAKLLWYAVRS